MLPSERLFLNRDEVFEDRRALKHASKLYNSIDEKVLDDLKPQGVTCRDEVFESQEAEEQTKWDTVAEVAEAYPKLLVWLAEGNVKGLRNVFGFFIALVRRVPGAQEVLWHLVFRKVADHAPWRIPLYEAIRQRHLRQENSRDPR